MSHRSTTCCSMGVQSVPILFSAHSFAPQVSFVFSFSLLPPLPSLCFFFCSASYCYTKKVPATRACSMFVTCNKRRQKGREQKSRRSERSIKKSKNQKVKKSKKKQRKNETKKKKEKKEGKAEREEKNRKQSLLPVLHSSNISSRETMSQLA